MYETFSKLRDPRVVGRSSNLLTDILTVNGKQTSENRFHISSIPTNSPSNTCIRSHWEVGNKLHWTLDMTFRKNQQRRRCKMAAQNFSILTKFAFNLLKKDKSSASETNASRPHETGNSFCNYYKFDAFVLLNIRSSTRRSNACRGRTWAGRWLSLRYPKC